MNMSLKKAALHVKFHFLTERIIFSGAISVFGGVCFDRLNNTIRRFSPTVYKLPPLPVKSGINCQAQPVQLGKNDSLFALS